MMLKDRAGKLGGAGLAGLWMAGVVLVDLAIPGSTAVVSVLFALGPLIACAVLTARVTAAFGVLAVVLTVISGTWNNTWMTAQQIVRIVDVALISSAAVVIATVRVRREQRFARVAVIAETAQRAILPKLPSLPGQIGVATRYLSAAEDAFVGGDLYDYYHSDAYLRLLVGDVRGKGVAGVEQAARVIRAFRQSAATMPRLTAVAQEMSAYLMPFFDDEEFVTAVLVEIPDPSHLTLVSCGHPPPVLVTRDGRAKFLEAPPGLPLGLGQTYSCVTVPWERGERLLMYTDGLSEARDARGRFLSPLDLVPQLSAETLEESLDLTLDAVRDHVPSGDLTDDLAVVLLENIATGQQPGAAPGSQDEAGAQSGGR
jgi:hypothetical protein